MLIGYLEAKRRFTGYVKHHCVTSKHTRPWKQMREKERVSDVRNAWERRACVCVYVYVCVCVYMCVRVL